MSLPDHRGLPPNDGLPPEWGGPVTTPRRSVRPAVVALALGLVLLVGGAVAGFFAIASFDSGLDEEGPAAPTVSVQPTSELDRPTTVPPSAVATTATPTAAPTSAAPTTATPVVDLFAGTQAAEVVAAVAAGRGADPLRILEFSFYPTYAFGQVQDPRIPQNVDRFPWRDGVLGSPEPVRLAGSGELEANLFSSTEVDWTVIPALVASAPATAGIADGKVTHVIVKRALPFRPDIVLRVYVSNDRASGYVEADAKGNVERVVT